MFKEHNVEEEKPHETDQESIHKKVSPQGCLVTFSSCFDLKKSQSK